MRLNLKRTAAVITAAAIAFSEGAALNVITAWADTVDTGISASVQEETGNVTKVTEAEYGDYERCNKGFLLISKIKEKIYDSDDIYKRHYIKGILEEDSVLMFVSADGTVREFSNKDSDGNILFDTIYGFLQNKANPDGFLVEKDGKFGYIDEYGNYTETTIEESDTEEGGSQQDTEEEKEQESSETEELNAAAAGADYYTYDGEKKIILLYDEVEVNDQKKYKLNAMYDCSGETAVKVAVEAGDLYQTTRVQCKSGTQFVTGNGLYDGSDYYILRQDGALISVPVSSQQIFGITNNWTTVVGRWLESDLYYFQTFEYAYHYYYDLFDADNNYVDTLSDCIVDYKGYSTMFEPYINNNTYDVNSYGYATITHGSYIGQLYSLSSGTKQSDLLISSNASVIPGDGKGLIVYREDGEYKYGCALIRDISKDAHDAYESPYAGYTGKVNSAFEMRWLENGVMVKSREIYDAEADAWYWFDEDGTAARDKFVFIPYDETRTSGKWVYYSGYNMKKGAIEIGKLSYMFDEITGEEYHLRWAEVDGVTYWYENGVRQGTEGRGKEIYDPGTDAWYWLDAVDGGKKAVSKDVYLEDGDKWVRYDENGHMVKGWDTNDNGTYYFDEITGAMQKGNVTIDGKECYFDTITGVMM